MYSFIESYSVLYAVGKIEHRIICTSNYVKIHLHAGKFRPVGVKIVYLWLLDYTNGHECTISSRWLSIQATRFIKYTSKPLSGLKLILAAGNTYLSTVLYFGSCARLFQPAKVPMFPISAHMYVYKLYI